MILQASPIKLKIILVATAEIGNAHAIHTMVLDCVLLDFQTGKYSFKFKNTDRNMKAVIIDAGKLRKREVVYDTVLSLLVGQFLGRNFRENVPLIGCPSNRGFRKNEKNQKR